MDLQSTLWSNIPFDVEVPYAMRPHMRSWQVDEPILTTDSDFDQYKQAKLENYNPVYGDNVSPELVYDAATALKSYDALAPVIEGDAPVWKLTMSLQEDFVIWAPNRKGDLSAQILSVCMPSGWDPKTKVNKTFLEIHDPIPDFDTINKASHHIAKMITTKGPFVRSVWSIANRPGLCRHPSIIEPWSSETVDDMWYRCEKQTTIPIQGKAALFLIRVYMIPLREVFKDRNRQEKIINSIMSMTDAVIDYKGFGYLKSYFASQRVLSQS